MALSEIDVLCSRLVVTALLVALGVFCGVTPSAIAAQLDVTVVDNRISMNAEAVGLGELLRMLDRAVGTESIVPVELAGRNVSVEFADLGFDDAVDKIFEGLSLDYIVIGRHRILVTAGSGVPANNSGAVTTSSSIVTSSPPPPQAVTLAPAFNPFQAPGFGNQAVANPRGANQAGAQQPAFVQTPFGPLVNPRAVANAGQAQPTGPLSMPGQSGFPGGGTSAIQPGFGSNQPGNGQPSIFGNTSPTILDLNKQQPATQPPFPGTTPATPGATFPQTNPTIPPTTNPNFPPPQQ